MIVHFKKTCSENIIKEFKKEYNSFIFETLEYIVSVTSSAIKSIDAKYEKYIEEKFVFDDDIQLASKKYKEKRTIVIDDIVIGGDSQNTLVMTGPCSVESLFQIEKSAKMVKSLNLKFLRAGCYKPRTSPYSFQGLGEEGLILLDEMRKKYDLKIITEVKDASHIDKVIEYSDIVQIGAKAMYDHGILKKCSKIKKPVLIKRGFGSTLQEFVQAAEFVLSGGNENVILCERGIRTFETKTRFTLDLCGVAFLKQTTNLPIVLDPTHAMGFSYGIADLTRACLAMGIDGLLIESHYNPKIAKSDASQQLNFDEFEEMLKTLTPLALAINRNLV